MRGQPKAFVQIKYRGTRDDECIPPDSLDKSFKDNNVATDSTLNLVEMRNFHMAQEDSDAPDEEGEEEHEEMEEEIEENQPVDEQPPLNKVDTMAPLQHTMPNVVESKPQMGVPPPTADDHDKKASDVLFDSDDGEGQNNAAAQK